jgi:topoisomerase-4 subunit B
VIDNNVDEAIAGHCKQIDVTLYKDGSVEVTDDGRGMPVDVHPQEKISGVELILTRLHAGGKFNDQTYSFAGGLHGVGVSVVNALSKHLECWVRRGGKEYNIAFKDGRLSSKLEVVGTVGARNTGTTVRFWPDPKFFDSIALPCRISSACSKPRRCCAPDSSSPLATSKPARRTSGSTQDTWASI